jgi:hypothetical protein
MPTDEYERAGFILAMRAVARDKAAILKARERDFRKKLASIRRFRRGLIEAHRADYDGYRSNHARASGGGYPRCDRR